MDALAITDLANVVLGATLAALVTMYLGAGLARLLTGGSAATAASVRVVRTTFLLLATAVVLLEINLMRARVPDPLCGLTVCNPAAHAPAAPADVVLAATTRFGVNLLSVGLIYLMPVWAGFRLRVSRQSAPAVRGSV